MQEERYNGDDAVTKMYTQLQILNLDLIKTSDLKGTQWHTSVIKVGAPWVAFVNPLFDFVKLDVFVPLDLFSAKKVLWTKKIEKQAETKMHSTI